MTTYRIYIERKNVKAVCLLTSEHYGSFTIYEGVGYWQGQREKSLIVEIICSGSKVDDKTVKNLCLKIKGLCRQEAVMMTKIVTDMEIVR